MSARVRVCSYEDIQARLYIFLDFIFFFLISTFKFKRVLNCKLNCKLTVAKITNKLQKSLL